MIRPRWSDASVLAGLVVLAGAFVLLVIGRFGRAYPGHDVYAQAYPNLIYLRTAIATGHGVLWNELQNCGQPFFGIISSAVLDPVNLVALVPDPDLARELGVFLYLFIAGSGTFLAGREIGLGRVAAFCAALAFTWGGGMAVVGRTHQVILASYVWLPWAAFLGERILRAPGRKVALALGTVLTLQLFAGFPQVQLFTYQWLALRFAFEVATRRDSALLPKAAALGLAMALPALLGAVQLVPALEVVRESVRGRELGELELVRTGGGAEAFDAFRTRLGIRGFGAGNLLPVTGVLLAGLAVAAAPLRRMLAFLGLALGLCFALSFVDRIFELYQLLPLGRTFRLPSRYLWVASFALSLASGCGVEAVLRAARSDASGLLYGAGTAFALLLGLHALSPVGFLPWEWLLLGAAASVGAAAWLSDHAFAAATVLVALLASNLFALAGRPAMGGAKAGTDLPYSEERGVLLENRWAFERVDALRSPQDRMYQVGRKFDYALTERSASVFGVPSIVDYEHLTSQRYAELFVRMFSDRPMESINQFIYRFRALPANRPLFDLVAARYLVVDLRRTGDPASFEPSLRLVERRGPIAVYENPHALPRAFFVPRLEVEPESARRLERLASPEHAPRYVALVEEPPADGFLGHATGSGSARILASRSEGLDVEVQASRAGFLFVSDQDYPGWRATVDGAATPIQRANHAFRVVRVPAGRSRVEFRYRPRSLALGAAISALTLAGLAAHALHSHRRSRRGWATARAS